MLLRPRCKERRNTIPLRCSNECTREMSEKTKREVVTLAVSIMQEFRFDIYLNAISLTMSPPSRGRVKDRYHEISNITDVSDLGEPIVYPESPDR